MGQPQQDEKPEGREYGSDQGAPIMPRVQPSQWRNNGLLRLTG